MLPKPQSRRNTGSNASLMTFHGVPRTSDCLTEDSQKPHHQNSKGKKIRGATSWLGNKMCWEMVVPLRGSQTRGRGHPISPGIHFARSLFSFDAGRASRTRIARTHALGHLPETLNRGGSECTCSSRAAHGQAQKSRAGKPIRKVAVLDFSQRGRRHWWTVYVVGKPGPSERPETHCIFMHISPSGIVAARVFPLCSWLQISWQPWPDSFPLPTRSTQAERLNYRLTGSATACPGPNDMCGKAKGAKATPTTATSSTSILKRTGDVSK